MTEQQSPLRRTYFVDKRFQARFIGIYLLLAILSTVLFAVSAYLILNRNLGESLFSAHLALKSTGELLRPTLLLLTFIFLVIMVIATIVITMLVSHRISGPLFAICRYLRKLGDGDLTFEAKLRTHDQTAALAENLNDTVHSLAGKLSLIKETTETLRREIGELKALSHNASANGEDIARLAGSLGENVRVLEEKLSVFRTN